MDRCFFCKEPEDMLGLLCNTCYNCANARADEGVFGACLAGTFVPEEYIAAGGKQAGTTVQTLIFDKDDFPTMESAVAWAERNDFRTDKVDETGKSWRIRQREQSDFKPDGFGPGEQFRTITIRPGVQAVIGLLTEEATMAGPGKTSKLRKAEFKIAFIDEEKRIVFGPVLVPDEVDLQGDFEFREDIEKAAHNFLRNHGKIGEQHQIFQGIGEPVESHILRQPMQGAKGETLEIGTWFLGVKITNDPTWEKVLSKKLNGFSIGFSGERAGVT